MNFEVTKENGNTVITVNTRLDSTTAGDFDELLKKEVPDVTDGLVLDFANVDFISSIGLRVLVATYRQLEADKKNFAIKNANSSVKEVFKLSGLLNVFKLI